MSSEIFSFLSRRTVTSNISSMAPAGKWTLTLPLNAAISPPVIGISAVVSGSGVTSVGRAVRVAVGVLVVVIGLIRLKVMVGVAEA